MTKLLLSLCLAATSAIALVPSGVKAGDGEAAPRRVFRQSSEYPYVFVPVSYLEQGPKAMRFAAVEAECAHRNAPLLPSPTPVPTPATKPEEEPRAEKEKRPAPSPSPAGSPAQRPVPPEFPPPVNSPQSGGPDLSKMPDDVTGYFKNPYNSVTHGRHLFDPIFEPAYHEGPKTKATYQLTDKP